MDVGTLTGDIYYESGLEIMPEHEELGRVAIHLAWGFYRDAEDVQGMKKCYDFLKDDLDSFAKNMVVEKCFENMRVFRDFIEIDDVLKRLLDSTDGIILLKARIKPQVLRNLKEAEKYLESE